MIWNENWIAAQGHSRAVGLKQKATVRSIKGKMTARAAGFGQSLDAAEGLGDSALIIHDDPCGALAEP